MGTSPLHMKILFPNFPCNWVWPGRGLASSEGALLCGATLARDAEPRGQGQGSATPEGMKSSSDIATALIQKLLLS